LRPWPDAVAALKRLRAAGVRIITIANFSPRMVRANADHAGMTALGGWDAHGAKSFGYPTYWVNRFQLPAERLGTLPDGTSKDLGGLLEFVLGPWRASAGAHAASSGASSSSVVMAMAV
jgi:2-haloacid dehalogenase